MPARRLAQVSADRLSIIAGKLGHKPRTRPDELLFNP